LTPPPPTRRPETHRGKAGQTGSPFTPRNGESQTKITIDSGNDQRKRLGGSGLSAPSRNELQTRETDDLAEVERFAKELAYGGFTVWVYSHRNKAVCAGGSDYQTIFKFTPDGQVVDLR
jgi:hypothetical protein